MHAHVCDHINTNTHTEREQNYVKKKLLVFILSIGVRVNVLGIVKQNSYRSLLIFLKNYMCFQIFIPKISILK